MADRPQTSTVREAMHLAAAAEEILAHFSYRANEVAAHLGTIIDAARALNGYQVEDVQEHIRYRAQRVEDQSPYTVLSSTEIEVEDGPEEEPEPSEAEGSDREQVERARARVDAAIGGSDG